jgi:hypothetical protein
MPASLRPMGVASLRSHTREPLAPVLQLQMPRKPPPSQHFYRLSPLSPTFLNNYIVLCSLDFNCNHSHSTTIYHQTPLPWIESGRQIFQIAPLRAVCWCEWVSRLWVQGRRTKVRLKYDEHEGEHRVKSKRTVMVWSLMRQSRPWTLGLPATLFNLKR